MADQSLLMLLDEVRGKTLQVLEGVSADEARWAPPGLQNTILWHAGHSYVVVEWLAMTALGQPPVAPPGWFEIFSWESRPSEVPSHKWPTLAAVVAELESQRKRLRTTIGDLTEQQLDGASRRNAERTVRYHILHGLHDEARHSGEISLLRKVQSAKRMPRITRRRI
jgi:hypothetical protein